MPLKEEKSHAASIRKTDASSEPPTVEREILLRPWGTTAVPARRASKTGDVFRSLLQLAVEGLTAYGETWRVVYGLEDRVVWRPDRSGRR